jgi:hypothetical protein
MSKVKMSKKESDCLRALVAEKASAKFGVESAASILVLYDSLVDVAPPTVRLPSPKKRSPR